MGSKLGEKNIGVSDDEILCLKGGDNAPKKFERFPHVDSPVRSLTYMNEGQENDAIVFIP